MSRTHVVLDGLTDTAHARELSARWAAMGFRNAVDLSGQCAWLSEDDQPLSEARMAEAAQLARAFGVEPRDRVGRAFVPDNELPALRRHLRYEYKARVAQLLMFGLPAAAVHYLSPMLAAGGGEPRSMLYPWLFEALLVGWVAIAAAWPVLYQGLLSAMHVRMTCDLLSTALVAAAWLPSVFGTISLLWTDAPWFGDAPMYHAALYTIALVVLQRGLVHRCATQLAGRANQVLPRVGRLAGLWLVAAVVLALTRGWAWGLAVGMLLPNVVALGGIAKRPLGLSSLLPVIAFALFLPVGSAALQVDVDAVVVEIAFGFGLMVTAVYAWQWRKW